jgi:uncharacterized Ntn-hydrolase superfamily protein
LLLPGARAIAGEPAHPNPATAPRSLIATFSIAAFDPVNREWGVAVQSKFFGVGTVVPWAKAGVGAIATQASANVRFGPEGLALLEAGRSAEEALKSLIDADPGRARRQIGIVDAQGRAASHTGEECLRWAGHIIGTHYCVQGNILAGEQVVKAMAAAFESRSRSESGELADWLMAALEAGQDAGGDTRGEQSAALLVVREGAGYGGAHDRFIDLRVEDHVKPIRELKRLLDIHKEFYSRAHRPRQAEPKPERRVR